MIKKMLAQGKKVVFVVKYFIEMAPMELERVWNDGCFLSTVEKEVK